MRKEKHEIVGAVLREFLIRFGWQIFVLIIGITSLCWVSYGATYNFYFNNTEQGANSTATPTVTVSSEGKVTKSSDAPDSSAALQGPEKPAPTSASPATPTPAAALAAPAAGAVEGTSTATVATTADPSTRERRHFRLAAGLADTFGVGASSFSNTTSGIPTPGLMLSADYEFSRGLGVGAFGVFNTQKTYGGAELQITPIRISVGRFEHILEMGPLIGFNTLTPVDNTYDHNWVSAHIGAKVIFDLAHNWGIEATVRGNYGFVMADAGLAISL